MTVLSGEMHGDAEMPQARTDDSKIIIFQADRARPARETDDGARGRILLFTGIRYERLADDAGFAAALQRREPGGDRAAP